MLQWVKNNRKKALIIGGSNFLIVALLMLFWTQPKEGLTAGQKAAANTARMEKSSSHNAASSTKSNASYTDEMKERQDSQVRIFVIIMLIVGVGMLGSGLLRKEK